MMWNFVTFHLRRRRDRAYELARRRQRQQQQLQQEKVKKSRDSPEDFELPEADQQLKKSPVNGKKESKKVK